MFEKAARVAGERAVSLRMSIEARLDRMLQLWLLLAGLVSAARIAASPKADLSAPISMLLPYALLVAAPIVSLVLALRWFDRHADAGPPKYSVSQFGKWRNVTPSQAKAHPLYGANGWMVSLMVGILLNIPVRAAEYFAALPAVSGNLPAWLAVLRFALTADVVVMSSLYAICFAAALKCAPSFPRLLALTWCLDLAFQGITAQLVAAEPTLPLGVATSLRDVLITNIWKVVISLSMWLPYLVFSKRVNVTYRHRVEA